MIFMNSHVVTGLKIIKCLLTAIRIQELAQKLHVTTKKLKMIILVEWPKMAAKPYWQMLENSSNFFSKIFAFRVNSGKVIHKW